MARLHEYQGKAILASHGIATPNGRVAGSAGEAARIARELGGPVVLKIQAWTTGRKAMGGVAFAQTPEEAGEHAGRLLGLRVGNFPVTEVLVEERIAINDELFVSLSIDDAARRPVMLLSLAGGSGVEQRAGQVHRLGCDVRMGPDRAHLGELLGASAVEARFHEHIVDAVIRVFEVARDCEARSVEVNPLVTTGDGRVLAADCRMTIDDYAVFRHPDLGIDIARELDHPPTALERVAYAVEQADHRGTFYFAQLHTEPEPGSRGLIGFHGAGGGGSMMSMDAIVAEGFTIANFCDTSGNPSASKVYRAARIILSQADLSGYFGSGSGVASQEQFWSAYGLAKAFWEMNLDIPAVIRLGGNAEDRAVQILESGCADLFAAVEVYRKDDTPAFIADRFARLVDGSVRPIWKPRRARVPDFVGSSFNVPITGGRVWIDTAACDAQTTALLAEHSSGLIKDQDGSPILAVSEEQIAGKDSELIACEVELRRAGRAVLFVELDIPGLGGLTTGPDELTTERTEEH